MLTSYILGIYQLKPPINPLQLCADPAIMSQHCPPAASSRGVWLLFWFAMNPSAGAGMKLVNPARGNPIPAVCTMLLCAGGGCPSSATRTQPAAFWSTVQRHPRSSAEVISPPVLGLCWLHWISAISKHGHADAFSHAAEYLYYQICQVLQPHHYSR